MWRDPYPLVALEAMSQGAVVVASRIGGLPEMVQDDVTGKLFEPGDSAELAAILQRLWRDAELCSAIRQRAVAWIDANNSPGVYQDRLIRAYRLADTLHGQAKRSTLQSRRSLAHAP